MEIQRGIGLLFFCRTVFLYVYVRSFLGLFLAFNYNELVHSAKNGPRKNRREARHGIALRAKIISFFISYSFFALHPSYLNAWERLRFPYRDIDMIFQVLFQFWPREYDFDSIVHNHVLFGIWIHLRSSFPRALSRQLAFVLVDQFFYCYNALTSCLSVSGDSIMLLSRSISRAYGQTFNRFYYMYQQRIWFAQYKRLHQLLKCSIDIN